MTTALRINGERLQQRIAQLAEVGAIDGGGCARLALSDEDKAGRDLVCEWMRELGLSLTVDAIGNVVGTRAGRVPGAPGCAVSRRRQTRRCRGMRGVSRRWCWIPAARAATMRACHRRPSRMPRCTSARSATPSSCCRFCRNWPGPLARTGGWTGPVAMS